MEKVLIFVDRSKFSIAMSVIAVDGSIALETDRAVQVKSLIRGRVEDFVDYLTGHADLTAESMERVEAAAEQYLSCCVELGTKYGIEKWMAEHLHPLVRAAPGPSLGRRRSPSLLPPRCMLSL
jgi:hypothetical protein